MHLDFLALKLIRVKKETTSQSPVKKLEEDEATK